MKLRGEGVVAHRREQKANGDGLLSARHGEKRCRVRMGWKERTGSERCKERRSVGLGWLAVLLRSVGAQARRVKVAVATRDDDSDLTGAARAPPVPYRRPQNPLP